MDICDNCRYPIFDDDFIEEIDECGYCKLCEEDIESCDCDWCECWTRRVVNEVCLIEEEYERV